MLHLNWIFEEEEEEKIVSHFWWRKFCGALEFGRNKPFLRCILKLKFNLHFAILHNNKNITLRLVKRSKFLFTDLLFDFGRKHNIIISILNLRKAWKAYNFLHLQRIISNIFDFSFLLISRINSWFSLNNSMRHTFVCIYFQIFEMWKSILNNLYRRFN